MNNKEIEVWRAKHQYYLEETRKEIQTLMRKIEQIEMALERIEGGMAKNEVYI